MLIPQSLTLRYDKVLCILDPTERAKGLAGKKVVVCDYPDGRLEIMHESFTLPYRTFDTLRSVHRAEVVEKSVSTTCFPSSPSCRLGAAKNL